MGTRRGRQWVFKRQNSAGAGGSGSSALLSVLPGGPSTSQIANPGGLTDTKGNAVTCARSTFKYARTGTSGDAANLAANPESFDKWTVAAGAVVVADQYASPLGQQTADQLQLLAVSSGSQCQIFNVFTGTAAAYTFSINAYRASGVGPLYIQLTNLSAGASNTYAIQCPASTPGTWVRTSVTGTLTAGAWYAVVGVKDDTDPGEAPSAASTWAVANAKLELGSSATPYISPMLRIIPANVPSVEPEGLLVEGATTNLILQSEDFTSASWGKNGVIVLAPTITADVAIAPNGTLSADQIALPSVIGAGAASVVSQGFAATAASYTASVYLRSPVGAGTKTIYLAFTDNATIPTQYKGTTSCTVTETGWTRFSCTATLTAATWFIQAGVDLRDGGQLTQGAQAIYAWGAQVEALAFASSYVPTVASTAARSADVVSVPNPITTSTYRTQANVTPAPAGTSWTAGLMARRLFSFGNTSSANSSRVEFGYDGNVYFFTFDGTTTVKGTSSTQAFVAGSTHLLGQLNSAGTLSQSFDGAAQTGSPTGAGTGIISPPSTVYFGDQGGSQPFAWLKDIKILKK